MSSRSARGLASEVCDPLFEIAPVVLPLDLIRRCQVHLIHAHIYDLFLFCNSQYVLISRLTDQEHSRRKIWSVSEDFHSNRDFGRIFPLYRIYGWRKIVLDCVQNRRRRPLPTLRPSPRLVLSCSGPAKNRSDPTASPLYSPSLAIPI